MKKLILFLAIFLATQSQAQWAKTDNGFVFRSTFNYSSYTNESNYNAPIEFYLNTNSNTLQIVYTKGLVEKYYSKNNGRSVKDGRTTNGKDYSVYRFFDFADNKSILFQVFTDPTSEGKQIVRILYSDAYIEFQE